MSPPSPNVSRRLNYSKMDGIFFSDMRELLLGQQFKLLLCIVLNAFLADLRIQLFANI